MDDSGLNTDHCCGRMQLSGVDATFEALLSAWREETSGLFDYHPDHHPIQPGPFAVRQTALPCFRKRAIVVARRR
jgi:hypothetical protein